MSTVMASCPFCNSTGEVLVEAYGYARCYECARTFDPMAEKIRPRKRSDSGVFVLEPIAIHVEIPAIVASRLIRVA